MLVTIGDLMGEATLKNVTKNIDIKLTSTLSKLDAEILKVGGKLPWIKSNIIY